MNFLVDCIVQSKAKVLTFSQNLKRTVTVSHENAVTSKNYKKK